MAKSAVKSCYLVETDTGIISAPSFGSNLARSLRLKYTYSQATINISLLFDRSFYIPSVGYIIGNLQ